MLNRVWLLLPILVLAVMAERPAAFGAESEDLAGEIVRSSGVKAGLCVHLGCGDGKLTAALRGGGKFLVQGLALDAASLEEARKHIRSQGTYGPVSVEAGSAKGLPYADSMVNLVVADNLPALLSAGLSLDEMMRVLCPNGVAYIGSRPGTDLAAGTLDAKLTAAGIKEFEIVKRSGVWARIVKPRPAAMDEWTHWRHGPDGNPVSKDTLVGPPAHLRWTDGPAWGREHSRGNSLGMLSSGGRLFFVCDEAPQSVEGPARPFLTARDACNGLTIWKRPIERRASRSGAFDWQFKTQAFVAAGDRVYAALGPSGTLTALDAATGEVVKVYEGLSPDLVLLHGDRIVSTTEKSVSALEAATGKGIWAYPAGGENVAVGGGSVFLCLKPGPEVVNLDLDSGKERWRRKAPCLERETLQLCVHGAGALILLGSLGYDKESVVHALSPEDGRELWNRRFRNLAGGYSKDVFVAGGLVWICVWEGDERKASKWAALGLDPASGEVKRRIDFPSHYSSSRGHHRCYQNRATESFLLLGSRGTDLVDLKAGKVHDAVTIRGDCVIGVLPANGLLYSPPHACVCNAFPRGLLAMAASDGREAWSANDHPLERGPACESVAAEKASPDDWPAYRHDPWRSGTTAAAVPRDVAPMWDVPVGGRVTAPTVASGTVYVASKDEHRIVALDAGTGGTRWSFTAGGRVDSPPTIHEGLCIFGCRDGRVYCLRASDGELAWRFRAAPAARRIVASGQLESSWPVHGSVLVAGGIAYFAAGRSPEFDGGVQAFAVECRTGRLVWTAKSPVFNDLMVAQGRMESVSGICMRDWQFDPKTGEKREGAPLPLRDRISTGLLDGTYPARGMWSDEVTKARFVISSARKTYGLLCAPAKQKAGTMTRPGKGDYSVFCKAPDQEKPAWSVPVPLRVRAMVEAADVLFVAGPPDVVDGQDYWAALDGRKGAELWALSAADGKRLHSLKLDAVPVFDGLAAAGRRLYLSTEDGKVRCFGKE